MQETNKAHLLEVLVKLKDTLSKYSDSPANKEMKKTVDQKIIELLKQI